MNNAGQSGTWSTDRLIFEARRLLAHGRYEEAIAPLNQIISTSLSVDVAHALCLDALLRLGRRAEAEHLLAAALELDASTPDALDALAFHAGRLGQHHLANSLYRRAVGAADRDGQIWYNFAASERSLGRLESAAAACERALECEPDRFPALLLRSELLRATPSSNHVEQLRSRIAGEPEGAGRMFIAYALGKELHDLGDYDGAFGAFALGARLRRQSLHYDIVQDEEKLARICAEYRSPRQAASSGACPARHIFVVGLPRSGTTLTERILGGLPGVRSNGETENFSQALLRGASRVGRDIFERCARGDDDLVAAEYARLADHEVLGGSIVEKLPMNYLYLGAIARALPDARIIWVRRHPIDSCFAMFRTLFGEAYPFSYDFADLARYYAAYAKLMQHWCETIPDFILAVDYEEMVARPEQVGPTLAAHCGLAWTDDALDITRNASVSLTASAAQVREPIYSRSSGIWRKYGSRLDPLAEQLHLAGVDC